MTFKRSLYLHLLKKTPVIVFLSSLLLGCATRKEVVYFQEAESLEGYPNLMDYEPVIEKNDVLSINVSSIDDKLVEPFRLDRGNQRSGGGGGNQNLSLTGYLVDPEGNIQFPVVGQIKVAGLTRREVQQEVQEKVRRYVTDAVVDVRIMNFRVTVLGEVGNPGRVDITDGRITIPELLAMAGDISYSGKRENILVIREIDGVKKVGRVDMTEAEVFKNPFYYLKQNDLVYVEPTYKQVKAAGLINSYGGLISLGTTILSLVLLLNR